MPELGTYGSVRGVPSNGHPYRDRCAARTGRLAVDNAHALPTAPAFAHKLHSLLPPSTTRTQSPSGPGSIGAATILTRGGSLLVDTNSRGNASGWERDGKLRFLPIWEILPPVRVIARRSLQKFWERPGCADARGPLHSWYAEAIKATWRSPQDIKDQYASASICGNNRVVFNVGGNKCRLLVEVQYQAGIVWVKFVGTHAQYDRIDAETANDH